MQIRATSTRGVALGRAPTMVAGRCEGQSKVEEEGEEEERGKIGIFLQNSK